MLLIVMKMKNMRAIIILLFLLLLSASLFSTSFAGRKLDKLAKEGDATHEALQEDVNVVAEEDQESAEIHERLLKVNTKDYGRYNPAPALVRPPFKLIPN